MHNDDVLIKKLMKLFNTYFEIDFTKNKTLLSKNLLSEEIGMAPRDLLCLFFHIEETFKINIPEDAITNGQFAYFDGIIQIISEAIPSKQPIEY